MIDLTGINYRPVKVDWESHGYHNDQCTREVIFEAFHWENNYTRRDIPPLKMMIGEDDMKKMFTRPEPFKVIVNGEEKLLSVGKRSYSDIATLAGFDMVLHPDRVLTVVYDRGTNGASGTMVKGDAINIISGMIFNVADTSRA